MPADDCARSSMIGGAFVHFRTIAIVRLSGVACPARSKDLSRGQAKVQPIMSCFGCFARNLARHGQLAGGTALQQRPRPRCTGI